MGIAHVHKKLGQEVAERWNLIAAIVLISVYVLANVVIFLPAWCKQRRTKSQLQKFTNTQLSAHEDWDLEKSPIINDSIGTNDMPLPVPEGHHYVTLAELCCSK